MQRLKEHRASLARILKDERISPNRRLFAELLSMYFDIDADPKKTGGRNNPAVGLDPDDLKRDKRMLYILLMVQYGNPKLIQWQDTDDVGPVSDNSKLEIGTGRELADVFAFLDKKPNASGGLD